MEKPAKDTKKTKTKPGKESAPTTPVLTKLDISGLVGQIVEVAVHNEEFKRFRVLYVDMGNHMITLRDREKVLHYFPLSSCLIRLKNYTLA